MLHHLEQGEASQFEGGLQHSAGDAKVWLGANLDSVCQDTLQAGGCSPCAGCRRCGPAAAVGG